MCGAWQRFKKANDTEAMDNDNQRPISLKYNHHEQSLLWHFDEKFTLVKFLTIIFDMQSDLKKISNFHPQKLCVFSAYNPKHLYMASWHFSCYPHKLYSNIFTFKGTIYAKSFQTWAFSINYLIVVLASMPTKHTKAH